MMLFKGWLQLTVKWYQPDLETSVMESPELRIDKEDVLCLEYIIHYLTIKLYLYPHLARLTINPSISYIWMKTIVLFHKSHVSTQVYGATLLV